MTKKNILIVDDEKMMREAIASFLSFNSFNTLEAETASEALEIIRNGSIDLIILDLMLPDMSGEKLCSIICSDFDIPIIMLTAKAAESDMLNGLNIGADDYITKPFSLKNLHARVLAVLRRAGKGQSVSSAEKKSFGGGRLIIDYANTQVYRDGAVIPLTPIEWKLLSELSLNHKRVFTRSALIDSALGIDFDSCDRAIDTHIKNLRKKLEDDSKNPEYIITVHGIGYKFGGAE